MEIAAFIGEEEGGGGGDGGDGDELLESSIDCCTFVLLFPTRHPEKIRGLA